MHLQQRVIPLKIWLQLTKWYVKRILDILFNRFEVRKVGKRIKYYFNIENDPKTYVIDIQ